MLQRVAHRGLSRSNASLKPIWTTCRSLRVRTSVVQYQRTLTTESPSQTPSPQRSNALHRTKQAGKYFAILLGSAVVGIVVLGGAIFIHDAFTYNEQHLEGVPFSPLRAEERGGPKNLLIARRFLRDDENEETQKLADKPRLVIVGGGWGVRSLSYYPMKPARLLHLQTTSLLSTLQKGHYQVIVVAPETFTTFTPLLPCRSPNISTSLYH